MRWLLQREGYGGFSCVVNQLGGVIVVARAHGIGWKDGGTDLPRKRLTGSRWLGNLWLLTDGYFHNYFISKRLF
jgi:hypothetical protein